MRLGIDDLHPGGATVDESITAIGWMKEHGLDLADVSIGFNTDNMQGNIPIGTLGGMVENATRVRTEVGIPIATSWNLGQPELANKVIQEELLDLILLGPSRPRERPLARVRCAAPRLPRPLQPRPRAGPGGSATYAAPMKPSVGQHPLTVQSSLTSPESQQQLPSSKRPHFPKNSPNWRAELENA